MSVQAPSRDMSRPPLPAIVGAAEWEDRLATLRTQEEALTAARMELAALRRQMPMTKIDKDYRFIGPDGEVGLTDLFGPHRQLVTYRFFYGPDSPNWPDGACPGCSMFAESVTHLAHLAARDVALAFVSGAPQDRIETYKERMGWITPWYTFVGDDFSRDFGVDEWFGINVFLRDGDDVYRTYFLNGPEVESVGPVWTFLDLVPYGRQAAGEDSPDGYPQGDPYAWYRLHDEYD